jgi:hypothetical protein
MPLLPRNLRTILLLIQKRYVGRKIVHKKKVAEFIQKQLTNNAKSIKIIIMLMLKLKD